MYGLKDYLINGLTHINNSIRPRHKVLTQLMIYATTRCQSQCQHCHIWEKDEEHICCNISFLQTAQDTILCRHGPVIHPVRIFCFKGIL